MSIEWGDNEDEPEEDRLVLLFNSVIILIVSAVVWAAIIYLIIQTARWALSF